MKLPTIDPTTGLIVSGVVAVLDAIAKGALALPDYVPVAATHAIQQTDAFIVGVFVLAVAPMISAFSSDKPGPLAPVSKA
jgi:hypothetical protein